VAFAADGRVSLVEGAFPGLNVEAEPRFTLVGDVNGRDYRVEMQDGEIVGIWMRVTETFGKRSGTSYWSPMLGPERLRQAERKLRPVIEETKAGLARAAARAAAPSA
jgi:hypothetical protein